MHGYSYSLYLKILSQQIRALLHKILLIIGMSLTYCTAASHAKIKATNRIANIKYTTNVKITFAILFLLNSLLPEMADMSNKIN